MAGSPIGELGDFLKANPSYTERDYMYKLSYAKIQLMTHDFSHVKYLGKADKEMLKKIQENKKKQADSMETLKRLVTSGGANYSVKMAKRQQQQTIE